MHPTPSPDVNAVLHVLLSQVQTTLGDRFIGLYVYGSLASGDFNPQRSDIDFLVVTTDELPEEMLLALEAMHTHVVASDLKWATRLEGDYIPQTALRRYDPAQARYPHLGVDGHFDVEQHGSDGVIQRYMTREQGITLAGPAPETLIDPIQPDELRQATLEVLLGWWAPMLHDPAHLHSSEYQAYAVLTMCRALYTLQYGAIVSKSVAARWAQEALGERWAALIERASAWQHDEQLDDLNETLDFIRYTLERSQQLVSLS
jgi:predicted nucleotidyltransferase